MQDGSGRVRWLVGDNIFKLDDTIHFQVPIENIDLTFYFNVTEIKKTKIKLKELLNSTVSS